MEKLKYFGQDDSVGDAKYAQDKIDNIMCVLAARFTKAEIYQDLLQVLARHYRDLREYDFNALKNSTLSDLAKLIGQEKPLD